MFRVEDIPVDKIEISNISTKIRYEGISELVGNIKKFGLLHPIIVYQKADDKYELVVGQRRLLAVRELRWNTIAARIIDRPKTDLDAKLISLSENIQRKATLNREVIETLTEAYMRYGSIKDVSKLTGMTDHMIRNTVKFVRLPKRVQDEVRNGRLDMLVAIKATDALEWDSVKKIDESKVLTLAREFEKMTSSERNETYKAAKLDPSKPLKDILKETKKIKKRNLRYRVIR